MSVKKIQMIPPGYVDVLHPETETDMVLCKNGTTLTAQLDGLNLVSVVGGTANALTLSLPNFTAYTTTYKFSFVGSLDNGGNATTLNINGLGAKPLYRDVDNSNPKIVNAKLYSCYYASWANCFFLEASASGNTIASHVLAGETCTTDAGLITGTMPNNTGVNLGNGTPTNSVQGASKFDYDISLPSNGYVDGSTKIHQTLTNLTPSNFASGVSIPELGVTGTLFAPKVKVLASVSGNTANFCAIDTSGNSYYTYYYGSNSAYHGVKCDKNGTILADVGGTTSNTSPFANEDGFCDSYSKKITLRDWNGTIVATQSVALSQIPYMIAKKNNKYYVSFGNIAVNVYDASFTAIKTISGFTQNTNMFYMETRGDKWLFGVNFNTSGNTYDNGAYQVDTTTDTVTCYTITSNAMIRLGMLGLGML